MRRVNTAAFWLLLGSFAWFAYSVSLPAGPSELARAEAACGIRVEKLTLAASGYLLDFRYRVLDRSKASELLDPETAPYLMLERMPVRLDAVALPLEAPSTTREPTDGVHVALFGNPGQLIKQGDRVTLVLGRFKARGLTVQ